MEIVLMVIFVLTFVLSVLRSLGSRVADGNTILIALLIVVSFMGMLWVAYCAGR